MNNHSFIIKTGSTGQYVYSHMFIRLCQNTPWLFGALRKSRLSVATGMNGGANHVEARYSEDGCASAQLALP